MSEATHILEAIQQGDAKAAEELLPLVYDELRKLAAHKMANERPGHLATHGAGPRGLGAAGRRLGVEVREPRAFLCRSRQAMRRILVESARRKKRLKHGGQLERVDLDAV